MIIVLVTAKDCVWCNKFKNSNILLPSDLEYTDSIPVGGLKYSFSSFKNLLSIDKNKITILLIEFETRRDNKISEITEFKYLNSIEKQGSVKLNSDFFIEQRVFRDNNEKIGMVIRYINNNSSITEKEEIIDEKWSTFIENRIPLIQIRQGIVFFPQPMIFDNEIWREGISEQRNGKNIPLYRRYVGLKTNEEGVYSPVIQQDERRRIKMDENETLMSIVPELLKNRELLLPIILRSESLVNKTQVVEQAVEQAPIIVKEVSKSEFMPYVRRRHR
jgi:hypothetical protein